MHASRKKTSEQKMRFRVLLILTILAIVIGKLSILQSVAARPAAATESNDQLLQIEEESNIPIIDLNVSKKVVIE